MNNSWFSCKISIWKKRKHCCLIFRKINCMILVFVLNIPKLNWISIDGSAVQLISSYLKLRSNIILSTSTKWKEVFITCIFHFILIFALAYFMSSGTNSYVIPMLKAIPCSLPKLTKRKVISSFKLIVSKIYNSKHTRIIHSSTGIRLIVLDLLLLLRYSLCIFCVCSDFARRLTCVTPAFER